MLRRLISVFLALLLIPSAWIMQTEAASQHRQVVFYHGSFGAKNVALTFDDGPHPRYTPEILALLDKYAIRATFFFIGQNIEYYPETAKAVLRAGHEIGNHTYSHPYYPKTDIATLAEEIQKTDSLLADIGCEDVPLFRPPQGLFGEELPILLRRIDKKAILWNIDTRDWEHKPSMQIVCNVEENLQGGDIILFHDYVSGESTTIPALKKLIPALLERGYRFVTVSELLAGEKTPASR